MLRTSLCLSLLLLSSYCSAGELVPLLAWSNSKSLLNAQSQSDLRDIFSGVNTGDFKLAVILKSNVLSFDHIAKYGGLYGEKNAPLSTLREYLSSSTSSLSAGVSGQPASDLTSMLSFAMDTKPTIVSGIPEIVGSGPHLVVVELPAGKDEGTFRAHDAIISKTASILVKTNLPYVVFYTADHTSIPNYHHVSPNLVRRSASLLNTNNGDDSAGKLCYTVEDTKSSNCTGTYGNGTCPACILMCLTPDIKFESISEQDNKTVILKGRANGTEKFFMTNSSCNSTGGEDLPDFLPEGLFSYISFNVEFEHTIGNESQGIFNHSLFFVFVKGDCNKAGSNNDTIVDCGFWTMQLYAGNNTSDLELYNQYHSEKIFSKLAVPLSLSNLSSLSYACGNSSMNNFTRANTSTSYQLIGLQVEPFTSLFPKNNRLYFGSAYNCQGYFGAVSFMGVVSIFILLVFLYISSVFIFSLQSIDRFDDPRAETIKVENLH